MSDVLTQLGNLINGLQSTQPRLYEALRLINLTLLKHDRQLDPAVLQSLLEEIEDESQVDAPSVTYSFTPRTIRFIWSEVVGASLYEVRKGADWDTASFQFRTSNLRADVDAISVGSHTYLFKSINVSGIYSDDPFSLIVLVPEIQPIVLVGRVIDNNILIDWDTPVSTFEIDHYRLEKGGVEVGTVRGTFFTRFEVVSGTYEFAVTAVDIAGNESLPATTALVVSQPPDYILQDQRESDFSGTKTNCILVPAPPISKLIAPVNTTETWDDHFLNHSWANIQGQIDAGFPRYCQPADRSATPDALYEEDYDYGLVIDAAIVTVVWSFNNFDIVNPVNIVVKMATSLDGMTWSAFTSGASQLMVGFQWLRFQLEFTSPADTGMIELFNLIINVAVKRENDAGEISVLAADVSGTAVVFNKAFKDIDAIVATVKGTTSWKAVVDFVDVPNPTGFSVYVFDDSGVRQDATVEWHARGVV